MLNGKWSDGTKLFREKGVTVPVCKSEPVFGGTCCSESPFGIPNNKKMGRETALYGVVALGGPYYLRGSL